MLADMVHYLLSAGILFFFFAWGMIAFDMTVMQKVFYPIGIVFFIATKAAFKAEGKDFPTNSDKMNLSNFGLKGMVEGVRFHIISIIMGATILGVMFFISSEKGQFLGFAQLAITGSGFSTWVTTLFSPAISGALGFIENRMFFACLNILLLPKEAMNLLIKGIVALVSLIPGVGLLLAALFSLLFPVTFMLPFVFTAVSFGLFHIIAYAVSWQLIGWAAMIMGLWIISYYLTGKDTTAADTSHFGWNSFLTAKEALSIAFF